MTLVHAALVTLATSQHGMFTTSQARRLGLDRRALTAAVAAGELVHPGRGLYAVAHLVDETLPERWHRHLAAGALLLYPDASLTSVTAVLAHGIGVWGCDLSRPMIRRPIHRSTGVTCFRVRRSRGEIVETDWGPASTVADSLVQLAIDHGVEQSVACADAALRTGRVTQAAVTESISRSRQAPGVHRAISMASFACGLRESVGESRCGIALELAGIRVVPQVEIRDATGHLVGRVDFVVEGAKVVVEFDGKVKFGAGDPEVLWREKTREDALRALGWTVVRVTWADLENGRVADKVRRALARAQAV